MGSLKQTAYSILVVDDEPAIVRLLSIVLRGSGYEVETAPDAETAWEIVRASKPKLIISDIRLPGMDGTELANKIRTTPDLADTPIILMSAYGDPTARIADAFVGKPFDIDELLDTVTRFMQVD